MYWYIFPTVLMCFYIAILASCAGHPVHTWFRSPEYKARRNRKIQLYEFCAGLDGGKRRTKRALKSKFQVKFDVELSPATVRLDHNLVNYVRINGTATYQGNAFQVESYCRPSGAGTKLTVWLTDPERNDVELKDYLDLKEALDYRTLNPVPN